MNKKLKKELLYVLNRATVSFTLVNELSIFDITLRNQDKVTVKYNSNKKEGFINGIKMCDNSRPGIPSTIGDQQDMQDILDACMTRYLERIETMNKEEKQLFFLLRGARKTKTK